MTRDQLLEKMICAAVASHGEGDVWPDAWAAHGDHAKKLRTAMSAALDVAMDELPYGRWISVKDRLPEDGVEVLICIGARIELDEGRVCRYVGWLDCDDQPPTWIIAGEQAEGVTHWQPLPDPPEEQP